jgi:hypothetical protein
VSPFRFLLLIVLTVVLTVTVYTFIQVAFAFNNSVWQSLYGRNFTWSDLPNPYGPVLHQLWDVIAPNFFLVALVLGLIIEFILMFRNTTVEGYQFPYG